MVADGARRRSLVLPESMDIDESDVEVAFYRGLVDTAFDALVIHQDGIVRMANQAFADMSGYTLEEILGQPVMNFVAPAKRASVEEKTLSPEARYESAGLCRDGTVVAVEICARNTTFRGKSARVTAIRDISERKRTEDALSRSEARFRQLIEHTPDMVAVHRDGLFVYANPALVRYLGMSGADELIGRPLAEVLLADDLPGPRAELATLDEPGPLSTLRHVGRRGEAGVLEVAAVPVDFDGAPATLMLGRDVTARKKLESALLQADLMASLGTLAAAAAHEINNPLMYTLVSLDLLGRRIAEMRRAAAREGSSIRGLDDLARLAADAREGADRVAQVAQDFKALSRTGAELREPVSVHEVLDGAIKMASNAIRHRARLAKDYAEVPCVEANRARLGQVFLNVLVNALQALPESDGGESAIEVRTRTGPAGEAIVEVEDNGPGIPADLLDRVFEPFFTTKPIGVGTGLGLSISRSIVQGLGGDILLSSRPGATVCRIVLPPAPGGEVRAAASERVPSVRPGRARVLVVDDEPAIARALAADLGVDFEVETAASGREALERVAAAAFDALVCDLMMPIVSGIDVHEELSRVRPSLARRTVFMTGGAFTPRARRFLEETRCPCLEKPFRADDLRAALGELLERVSEP